MNATTTEPTQRERIAAAKLFALHQFTPLRSAALRLALLEVGPSAPDWKKIHKIITRFQVKSAFSFYAEHPELYW